MFLKLGCTESADDVDGKHRSIAPSSARKVGVDHRGDHHFANGAHVAFGGVVHPLRVGAREALLDAAVGTELRHRHALVHGAVVAEDPRDAVGLAQLGLDTQHELAPDVHPLGLGLGEEAKDAASVVIYDGEQVEVPFRSGRGERSPEIRVEAFSLAFGALEPVAQLWLLVRLAHDTGSAGRSLLGHRDAVLARKVGEVAVAMAEVQLPQQVHVGAVANLVGLGQHCRRRHSSS